MTVARKRQKTEEPTDLTGRLMAMYRAQPAKLITFGSLLVVLSIVMVVNVFFRGKNRRADASSNRPLLTAPRTSRSSPRRSAARAWRYRDVAAEWAKSFVLIERVQRDPFKVEMTWFPLSPDRRRSSAVHELLRGDGRGDPLTRHIRRWAADVTRVRQERASEVAAVQSAANSLQLSTVMVSGSSSLAVINGDALKAGDKINGFTVVRIEPGRVVVNKNGIPIILVLEN